MAQKRLFAGLLVSIVVFGANAYSPPFGCKLHLDVHPRVILDSAAIETCAGRVDGAYAADYAAVPGGNDIMSNAFKAVMENRMGRSHTTYLNAAYNTVVANADGGFVEEDWFRQEQVGIQNRDLGIVFDWLYHLLTTTQRNTLATKAARWLQRGDDIYKYTPSHNMFGLAYYGYCIGALAFYGTPEFEAVNTRGQAFLDDVQWAVAQHVSVVNDVADGGGGWHEGFGYGWSGGYGLMPIAMEAWLTATGENYFTQATGYQDQATYFMHMARPHDNTTAHYDKTAGKFVNQRRPYLGKKGFWRLIASRYSDPYAQYWADKDSGSASSPMWQRGANRKAMWNIIFHNPAIAATGPSNALPTAGVHVEDGTAYMRGGYESADDVFASFRCRASVPGNCVVAENSFSLHRKGTMAIRSGYYAGWSSDNNQNYYGKEIASNVIHVDNVYQSSSASAPKLEFSTTANYDFVKGDASAQSGSSVSNNTRQFIRLKPDELFVVYDRIASTSVRQKRWLLHLMSEPIITIGTMSEEVAGHIVNYAGAKDALIFSIGAKLFLNTLLPVNPTYRKVGGDGYRFWVNENNDNYPLSDIDASEAGHWRIEVMGPPATSEVHLNLLVPTQDFAGLNATYSLLQGANYYGLETGSWVCLFNRNEATYSSVSYAATGTGTLKHLVSDFQNGWVRILQNNSVEVGVVEVLDNLLYFESTGGGQFSCTWQSSPGIAPTVEPVFLSHGLRAYPNPTSAVVALRIPGGAGQADLAIYDAHGRLVYRARPRQSSVFQWNGLSSSGTRLAPGNFLARVMVGEKSFEKQIRLIR